MKAKLKINEHFLGEFNKFLTKKNNPAIDNLIEIIEKYGSVKEINAKAKENAKFENKIAKLKKIKSPYLKDLDWLIEQREKNTFVSIDEYRQNILGKNFAKTKFDKEYAVTLEVSALQYFPWLITQAKKAIANKEIMPGRYIRVRMMKEQEADQGDLVAVSAAMDIIGATWVETLDTKGADGSNVHLGGPATITGYFGGVGQPNDYALKWVDEYLYYYTNYGMKQALNVNPGTILLGYLTHKLGIDMEFKISVFMGNDNPYSVMATLMNAKMFSRNDGSTPLIGFNFSNSINNQNIEICSTIREELGFEDFVRFEHHITEAYKSIVRQPYDRTEELMTLAKKVRNISAKHEGGLPTTEINRQHPSDILDYFMAKTDVVKGGLMEALEQNYLDKHDAVNNTAKRLTQSGIPFISANNLHK
ncbi:MAG: hypothetical protein A2504_14730 [Bdellovibrionales bacterium RIFOXYD12_FULL_39_22]|nr:MAG: hypothetical protein A2385_10195 [Bdellovibrionales bacterium RIFOXYB1_FULL_39_21]OFZ40833.1 MAG: hypothetical protein A2485_17355 [Bdellovibrionales bacterium RIFOXYC12_FULL_39_17]OFZ44374.1 MAG: hypothetical protein A2404_10965 [Bdellovibrionales bacterium RIFOXYC1_FULL_39_130]OFZ74121.1 MAG: hypothetical protein A2560_03630 [Bdellovibrionales bacterium RIFOXYD1_FULL_39_84]OFZ91970.1 MAG: hypothetical protein A2504_14730 [Bdellovibrionales bacterium RIFOXYD12_FULL_39_22]HLE12286.1 hy